MELDEDAGGSMISMQTLDGKTLLNRISNDLISYRDSGGLWRMGMEFWGGIWKNKYQASDYSTQLIVHEKDNGVEITGSVMLYGKTIRRLTRFSNNSPIIHCRVEGRAAVGNSVTIRFLTDIFASKLIMDTPAEW